MIETYELRRKHRRDDYPRYSVTTSCRQYFRTLEEAEKALPKTIEEYNQSPCRAPIYCISIIEQPFGALLNSDNENYSVRVYGADGQKIDERLFKSVPFAIYWPNYPEESENYGRPLEKVRFKIGDVIEDRWGLGVVGGLPPGPRETPKGDDSDDCYYVWDVDDCADDKVTIINDGKYTYPKLNHSHVLCIEAFEPRFEFSDKIRNRIQNIRDYLNSCDSEK